MEGKSSNHAGTVGEIEGQLLLAFSNVRDSQKVTFSFQLFASYKPISAQTFSSIRVICLFSAQKGKKKEEKENLAECM